MDIKQLLEKMEEFAGEKVGQKPGDQWRGTDAAPPGKKLVGDSMLKDLSKGKKAKSKEQELSEEFQSFLEAEFKDTVDKRPARKNARHSRGHEPQPRYKTVKADEDANTDNKLAKLLTRFINQSEGADRAVAADAIEYIRKLGHIEQFTTSLDYFAVDLDEGSEEDGSVEARWMVKVSDDEGDHLKTYHRKFPSLSDAKKAYENTPYATDFKYKPVKKDQVEEAVDSDIVQAMGQDSFNRAGYNPLRDERDYLDKLSKLSNSARKQGLSKEMKDHIEQRILDLNAEARKKGFTQVESRGHKILATKLKDVERAKKFAKGDLKIPTPQERQAQLKQLEKTKPVKEFVAPPPQGTANQTMQQKTQAQDPKQAQAVAQATQAMKSATGSSAPAPLIAKALDAASQGKPVAGQEASALQPLMKDMATIAQDPKLAGSFKSLISQINQTQIKQQQK